MDNKITLKDAYMELWHCRDFELKHLWQRSVFLGAFLIAAFAGYGQLLLHLLDNQISLKANLIGFGIAFVGLLLSLLWIMMAKGSKAWYERYENAISKFEQIAKLKADEFCEDQRISKVIAFAYGEDEEFKKASAPVSNWMCNTKGGAFSPSKINIAIGHLSFLVWLAIAGIHVMSVKGTYFRVDLGHLSMLFLIFGLLFFWIYARMSLRSSTIGTK